MGDRGLVNIKEDSEDKGVFLYTHWDGTDLPFIVQKALKKQWRWDDPNYLTRIIFCCMVPIIDWDEEHGYGIATTICLPDHLIIVVNVDTKTIGFVKESDYNADNEGRVCKTWTFEEYICIEEDVIKNYYHDA